MTEEFKAKYNTQRWRDTKERILARDGYCCQRCKKPDIRGLIDEDKEEPELVEHAENLRLEVHHEKYFGNHPSDTPDIYLRTLCEGCHEDEHAIMRAKKEAEVWLKIKPLLTYNPNNPLFRSNIKPTIHEYTV